MFFLNRTNLGYPLWRIISLRNNIIFGPFIAGKLAFKNKMIVSWIVLIVLIYCLFSGSAKIKDEPLMQNFSSLFDITYAFDSARE